MWYVLYNSCRNIQSITGKNEKTFKLIKGIFLLFLTWSLKLAVILNVHLYCKQSSKCSIDN